MPALKSTLLLFNLVTDRDDPIFGFTTAWINALASLFQKVVVVTMRKGMVAVAPNVEVYSVGKEKGYSELKRLVIFYRTIGKICAAEKIDFCFIHMIHLFAILFYPIARLQRIPTILWYAHGATPFMLKLAHSMVDRVVTSSPEGFHIKSDKARVIGQGIDTSMFMKPSGSTSPTGRFRLITVGRLSPVKHCDILIKAVKKVIDSGAVDRITYTLIGGPLVSEDRDYLQYLKKMVAESGLMNVITIRGPVSFFHLPPVYQEADLFLNASTTGSLDKAVLEAMSSECPVLTSNPPFKNILGNLSPMLFVEHNNPECFAAAISKVLSLSHEDRQEIGRRLRDIVLKNHSLDRMVNLIREEFMLLKQRGKHNSF